MSVVYLQIDMKAKSATLEETPEQTADAISSALDFLRGESDAVGMLDVSELIRRARVKAREHLELR